jgi:hypothetical protein
MVSVLKRRSGMESAIKEYLEYILGFPLPLLVAMITRVVVKGRPGEIDRTRSARTASLNVVPEMIE